MQTLTCVEKFFEALWEPEDPVLVGAYALMQSSMDELDRTINFANHAAIREAQEVTVHIDEKTDRLDAMLRTWRAEQNADVVKIYESNLELRVVIQQNHAETMDQFQNMQGRLEDIMTVIAKANARNKKDSDTRVRTENDENSAREGKHGRGNVTAGKKDITDKKALALRPFKAFFDDNRNGFLNWSAAQKENAAIHHEHREAIVAGTSQWIFAESAWEEWTSGTNSLLWLRGEDGVGKSFLTTASARNLIEQARGNPVAYFYFKEDVACLQSVQTAIACAALQMAELDSKYARYMGARLGEEQENLTENVTPWDRFFFSAFKEPDGENTGDAPVDSTLFLIFDGLDELPKEQLEVFTLFLDALKKSRARVRVAVSSRAQQDFIEQSNPLIIDVTKDKIKQDISTFVKDRIKSGSFPRLKKFSSAAKKLIRRKISKRADSLLYADHMLRRLNYIGREGAALKDLEDMPADLDHLYKLMLDECRRGRSKDQFDALKKVFAWLAFSKRVLSLAEVSEVVALTITEEEFDIEDEIIGRSAR